MHKFFLVSIVPFSLALALGACTAPEIESCESFREVRNNCEALNMFEEKPENYDLCNNVDPECKEFYDCAAQQACVDVNENVKNADPLWRLDYRENCPQPEDKECTDADIRP